MKIYTKTGDDGETGLVSGQRVSKSHLRLEAYGTVDELNSYLGVARSSGISKKLDPWLEKIQNNLFCVGSLLACDDQKTLSQLPGVQDIDILEMEQQMDLLTDQLPKLRNFILPGGHPCAAILHVARTICRRAERLVVKLKESEIEIDPILIRYLNRLSDTLFVFARYQNLENRIQDVTWNPKT